MVTRAEHRRATLLALSAAALDLFETVGPSVTVEQIAERAGVSRRTVFRYVDSREELAFIHPILWFDAFDAGLESAPADGSLAERLRIASQAIAEAVDLDPEPPRRAFMIAAVNPELHRGFRAVFQRWVDRVADEVVTTTGRDGTPDPFRARIIGAAVMGMVDAVTREWVVSPPDVTYRELCDRGYQTLLPLFEASD